MNEISIFNSAYVNEETMEKVKVKNYSDAYLYNKGDYEKGLFDFIMHAKRLDKSVENFVNLKNDIKRQKASACLENVLMSPKTVICISEKALPRAFKVFVAKDVKDKGTLKLFIDVTGIIQDVTYDYTANTIQILISYLIAGMNAMVYYAQPSIVINKSKLVESGAKCFSSLVFYIIDYLRISGDLNTRSKVKYFAAKYFQRCILNMDERESVENRARKIAQVSEQEVNIIEMNLSNIKNPYRDLSTFIQSLKAITKSDSLTIEVFVDKWMYNIGTGTQFGIELYPAFSNIIVYAYVGAYLNNQKTIEKATGRDMVDFVGEIIKMGNEVL